MLLNDDDDDGDGLEDRNDDNVYRAAAPGVEAVLADDDLVPITLAHPYKRAVDIEITWPAAGQRQVTRERDVTVDGRRYSVDSAAVGRTVTRLLVDGRQAEDGLTRSDGHYEVTSFRGRERLEVLDPLALLAEKTHGSDQASGTESVTAYMPGRVVEVLVGEGDAVTAGQGILVLEAMKMANEIVAARSGTIRRLFVATGEPVEGGDPLYEIE